MTQLDTLYTALVNRGQVIQVELEMEQGKLDELVMELSLVVKENVGGLQDSA